MKQKEKLFKIKIEKLVYGGKGLGRYNGRTIFVPQTVPGDVVLVEEVSRKSGYSEAIVKKLLESGESRIKPKCPYFGKCGGCDWQHIEYEAQVKFKRNILEENLQKIGRIKKPNIDEVIPSESGWNYRNRAQLKVKNGKVGFFAKGSHQVVDIERCFLLKEDIQDIMPKLKRLLEELPTEPSEFHIYSSSKNEVLLKIVYSGKFKKVNLTTEDVRKILEVNLVGFGIYKVCSDGYPERIKFFGRDFTYETVGKFKFRVSADSFFQVNRFQVFNLIDKVSKAAMEHQYNLAGDLYCGVGTLTIPVGRYVHRAFGVEANFSAISDALYNKDINGLRSVNFYCRETEEGLDIVKNHNPDFVVVDPPRSGLSQRVVRELANLPRLKKIVYVSCNPSTLARDIALFHQYGINMERAKLIDMFPQTYHVETIAFLRKVK
ncbi:RNA methyltransferase, TrmA family [Desulfurobacterium thermolithotrophum DSM 11699]|uniref:RNA methyltransferase, TrmA family n=1 Tax=Desulfurobacterium thermolithotrophum (strain DSM 11699 / BSA) TaxID=868864 RepID=F0S2A5_DESTD|nr:class I SAM-dependent RNA methyltransferase [Desulfurobacterium thermolithotrophum]ADY74120.1 RNA methyltransferase, TrmA family [Desulfurobacterium thermolithotrophum DSM 11699]